jgi:putative spermidine/putrescine transport system ATP-binding protein
MSFLQLQGLVKRYGDFTAVEKMDISVEKGEFLSLLGPSGCGKTTTLQMIAGFTVPTEGRIIIDNKDITGLKPNHRGLGIVFQSYALFPHMTVAENVSFGLEMRKVPKAETRRRVAEVLELVHLDQFSQRYPKELSGGQRQRVAVARALVIKPDVLLLDEPLSNLDAKLREDMQIELREIQRTLATTTILVTHDQSEALAMSDRIAVMDKGQLMQVDEPLKAYEFPQSTFVSNFLGKTNNLEGEIMSRGNGRMQVRVGEGVLDVRDTDPSVQGRVHLSIRPEKLHFAEPEEARIRGRIHTRVLLGNHFMFHLDTPVGRLLLTMENSGGIVKGEDEETGLTWNPGEIRIVQGGRVDG